jgi:hypothetical protein
MLLSHSDPSAAGFGGSPLLRGRADGRELGEARSVGLCCCCVQEMRHMHDDAWKGLSVSQPRLCLLVLVGGAWLCRHTSR